MKMFVSKSKTNPLRKYLKCKYWTKMKIVNYFIGMVNILVNLETILNEREIVHLLTKFGKDFGKEIGTQLCLKK